MDAISELLTRGVDKVYPTREALEKVLRSGKKLKLYQGFDPTGIKLHIGHLVGLRKLRQFQDLGHEVIFLVGDGTGQAGDPSGKTRTREKYLSLKELKENAKDYVMQAAKVVKFDGPNAAKILYNSDWLNKLGLVDILDIASHFTLQQMEERDIYEERKKRGEPINLREFFYPLLQGYDSVAMNVDLEIGGTDQTFNMLAGRQLVREYLNKEKFVITLPLIADATGKKIGKTEGNVIALTSAPQELFGMIMNLPDDVVGNCLEMITDLPLEEVTKLRAELSATNNPMPFKKTLAFALVKMLNDEKEATSAQNYFETTFQKKVLPTNIPVVKIYPNKKINPIDLLMATNQVKSKTEAKRLIAGKAIELDGKTLTDPNTSLDIKSGMVLKIGKHRFIKIIT